MRVSALTTEQLGYLFIYNMTAIRHGFTQINKLPFYYISAYANFISLICSHTHRNWSIFGSYLLSEVLFVYSILSARLYHNDRHTRYRTYRFFILNTTIAAIFNTQLHREKFTAK
ncbi:MAG: hypothetical protein J07HQW2_00986 [Haloquadratum walsbyi J07HQW2]|uniref:Uncharacterized protein n=1 Tax=Haloquadratum walsbyi J07HQW2 TaxID=1238425 RepID=U1NCA9_9EURY|nr:MAG: hypothetical protein J07HQW2_00986 [Haloquadratum walsbyi J07HQW2]